MENNQPILSCAGRDAVSIDSALLQQLLQNYSPSLIGVKERARQIANALWVIADGEYGDNTLNVFKGTITEEFLFIQLMEASRLARTVSAESLCDAPDLDNH